VPVHVTTNVPNVASFPLQSALAADAPAMSAHIETPASMAGRPQTYTGHQAADLVNEKLTRWRSATPYVKGPASLPGLGFGAWL